MAATAGDTVELLSMKLARPACCAGCDALRAALVDAVLPFLDSRRSHHPSLWAAAIVDTVASLHGRGWRPHSPPLSRDAHSRVEAESSPACDDEITAARVRSLLVAAADPPPARPDPDLGPDYKRGRDGWRLPWKCEARPTSFARPLEHSVRDWCAIAMLVAVDAARGGVEVIARADAACLSRTRIEWQNGKPRLVINLRFVNTFLNDDNTVSYEYATRAVRLRAKVAAKLDLEAAFRHVSVAEEDRNFLAFEVGGLCLRYKALPFGMSHSPRMFARAVAPAVAELRALAIKIVIYVDDMLILATTVDDLLTDCTTTVWVLREHGWRLSVEKCFFRPMTVVRFLGLTVDLVHQTLRIPASKAEKVRCLATSILQLIDGPDPSFGDAAEACERLAGMLSFCAQAWPPCNLFRESLDGMVHNAAPGADLLAHLRAQCSMWVERASRLPDLTRPDPGPSAPSVRGFGDASDTGWGGAILDHDIPVPDAAFGFTSWRQLLRDGIRDVAYDQWTAEEAKGSSTLRELWGLLRSLQRFVSIVAGRSVDWSMDSTAAVGATGRWSSSSREVRSVLVELWDFLALHRVHLTVTWVRRELGWQPVGDWLSRRPGSLNTAEWGLAPHLFVWIMRMVRDRGLPPPTLDAFATAHNRKLALFCSRHIEPGSIGSAESTTWPVATYAFPPITDVWRALCQFGRSPGARFLYLVAPDPLAASVPAGVSVVDCVQFASSRFPPNQWLIPQSGTPQPRPPPWMLSLYIVRRIDE